MFSLGHPKQIPSNDGKIDVYKAKLQKEGIFSSSIYLPDILLMKKLEIEKTSIQLLKLI